MDKIDLIVQKIEESKQHLDTKIDHINTQISEHKSESNKRFDEYNRQLEIHIQGVKNVNSRVDKTNKRVEVLEQPHKYVSMTRKLAIYIGSLTTVGYGVVKLIEYIKGL